MKQSLQLDQVPHVFVCCVHACRERPRSSDQSMSGPDSHPGACAVHQELKVCGAPGSELLTLSLTCCCAEACATGTLIEGPTLAWCRATKADPAAPPPGLVLPSSSGCSPSLLTSAKPRSSSGSARCPRDMFSRAGPAAKPCLAADCMPGCWGSPVASTACPGAQEVDWRLRRPSSAEAIGAVKAVGGGTAGAAGALPAQQLLQGRCIGPAAGGVLACEGRWEGMGVGCQMEGWPAGGWVGWIAVRWWLDAGMLSSGALSSAPLGMAMRNAVELEEGASLQTFSQCCTSSAASLGSPLAAAGFAAAGLAAALPPLPVASACGGGAMGFRILRLPPFSSSGISGSSPSGPRLLRYHWVICSSTLSARHAAKVQQKSYTCSCDLWARTHLPDCWLAGQGPADRGCSSDRALHRCLPAAVQRAVPSLHHVEPIPGSKMLHP